MKQRELLNIRIVSILLFSQVFVQGISQNLVRNWSFEDTVSCPTNTMQINKAAHWFTPRGGGGSSELFSVCNNYDNTHPYVVGIPLNIQGFQNSYYGNNYAGIYCLWHNSEYREYIETHLSQGLNPTINYYIEFWVSLSNESNYAVENIGAYFSTDTLHYSSNITTLIDAQVEYGGGIITDTLNWVKVSGYFKPDKDGYQFLTIGNFQPSDSTNKVLVGWNSADGAYYYIENVVVIDSALQHTIGINTSTPSAVPDIKVYPNPTNSDITIEFLNEPQSIIMVKIVDVVGKVVLEKEYEATQKLLIDINSFKSGIYLITLFTKNEIYETKRIIKY